MERKLWSRVWCLLLAFPLYATVATSADQAIDKYPLQPAVTSSPRATLKSFLESFHEAYEAVRERDMRRGAFSQNERILVRSRLYGCLDLSEVPPTLKQSRADETVAYLKEVLDRIELPPESAWPDEATIAENETERWTIPHTEITIAKVKEGPKQGQYLFTSDTVDRASEFYERVRHLPYQDRPTTTPNAIDFIIAEPGPMLPRGGIKSLPGWAHQRYGGQAIWQWIGLSLTLLISLLLLLVIYLIGIRRSRSASKAGWARYLLTVTFPVLAMLIPISARWFVHEQLQISGTLLIGVTYSLDLAFLFTLMMFVVGAANRLAALVIATPWIQPRGLDAQIVRLTFRVLGIAAAIIILLEGGQRVGIPLTTLLAGAGVSGLALALAAQDTLKNVFGSIMISLDKPYRVGERIVVKGYDGVVEEVGLRSTKIRMLTGHQTTIPNEEMARSDIENISRRPHIRRISDIPIPLETPSEKIDRAVDIVREIVTDHEGMDSEFPPRVYFNDFNRDSFNIRMIVWYHPPNYWDYLAFCQEMNRKIVEAFDAEGIRFAPPTSATYVAQDEDRPLHLEMTERPGVDRVSHSDTR